MFIVKVFYRSITTLTLFCCAMLMSCVGWAECVHGEQASRFVVQTDSAVLYDKKTGLYWQRCLVGYTWSPSSQACLLNAAGQQSLNWQQALTVAASGAWRLPNVKELESIVDRNCFEPALQTDVFPLSEAAMIVAQWTSSQIESYAGGAWTVNFKTGSVIPSDKSELLAVRLVRD